MTLTQEQIAQVVRWKCMCGYMITDLVRTRARFNFDCPRCGKYKIKEFSKVLELQK